jgi:HK97 family phage major capsid protein
VRDIPIQRFAGSVLAFGAYGAPALAGFRVSRRTLLVFGMLGVLLALFALGTIHIAGGLVLAGGFAKSADLREQALAKLLEAKALEDADGNVAAENFERQKALMAEFTDLDKQVKAAAESEGMRSLATDRLSWYQEAATGLPMRFARTQLDPAGPKSLGQQFVQSQAYQQLKSSGVFASDNARFRSDPVVAAPHLKFMGAASDVINTESGQPSAALVTPMYIPGALPLPQRPTIVRQLLVNADMPAGDQISYAAQTGFDSAAAAVAQATSTSTGAKPQSSIAWTRRTSDAEWIATWMVTTRQSLADENQTMSLIDNQGRVMIRIAEDDELLNGSGSSPHLRGLRNASGLQTLDLTGADNLDGIRSARRLVKTGVSRLDPTFIVVNPVDSEEIDLLKDGQNNYRGGNPIGNFGFDQPIWRLARAESEAMPSGKALVGAREGATVFERQPITVLTADQHSDFFVRNLVVILFEERLALPIWFPTAFVEITFAAWT